mgnify:CR=1 FL=1
MRKRLPLTEDQKKYLIPAFERKAKSITAIDVKDLTSYTDTLILIEGTSQRQVKSIAEYMIKQLKKQNIKALGAEGVKDGEWALLDYGDIIIHILETETNSFYDLDGLWADAPRYDLKEFDVTDAPVENE